MGARLNAGTKTLADFVAARAIATWAGLDFGGSFTILAISDLASSMAWAREGVGALRRSSGPNGFDAKSTIFVGLTQLL